ncbi:hypothetical protein SMICM17S_09254 [Streptomyces microflavus]
MSVTDFISANSADFARVRVPQSAPEEREKLTSSLIEAGGSVMSEPDGALRVTGLPLPRISDLAHWADVRLWELSPHRASLEEAYTRMTQGVVDYRSTDDAKAGLLEPPQAAYGGRRATGQSPTSGPATVLSTSRRTTAATGTPRRRPGQNPTRPLTRPPHAHPARDRASPGRRRALPRRPGRGADWLREPRVAGRGERFGFREVAAVPRGTSCWTGRRGRSARPGPR